MNDEHLDERPMWSSRTCGLLFAIALGAYALLIVIGTQQIRLHPSVEVELLSSKDSWYLADAAGFHEIVVIPGDTPPQRFTIGENGVILDESNRLASLLASDEPVQINAVSHSTISLAGYISRELGW